MIKKLRYLYIFLATLIVLLVFFPDAEPLLKEKNIKSNQLTIVALGDSLTEGVGDEVKNGGYVPYLKSNLLKEKSITNVDINNFGKSGDKVDDLILKIQTNKELREKLKTSDIITLTIGGNDLINVIKKNILQKKKS